MIVILNIVYFENDGVLSFGKLMVWIIGKIKLTNHERHGKSGFKSIR